MISQILNIHRINEEVLTKNPDVTLLLVDFVKAFDFIHRIAKVWSSQRNFHCYN